MTPNNQNRPGATAHRNRLLQQGLLTKHAMLYALAKRRGRVSLPLRSRVVPLTLRHCGALERPCGPDRRGRWAIESAIFGRRSRTRCSASRPGCSLDSQLVIGWPVRRFRGSSLDNRPPGHRSKRPQGDRLLLEHLAKPGRWQVSFDEYRAVLFRQRVLQGPLESRRLEPSMTRPQPEG